jgi:hypothetical protein
MRNDECGIPKSALRNPQSLCWPEPVPGLRAQIPGWDFNRRLKAREEGMQIADYRGQNGRIHFALCILISAF